jgi:hypothetical protein
MTALMSADQFRGELRANRKPAGGATVCTCGRSADEECGLADPSECSVHGGAAAAPEADEKLLAALRRLLGRRKDDGAPGDDDPPVAHEDAIRLAHKSLRTAKAYMAEGMTHHAKALSLLDGVVEALDVDPISATAPDNDPDAGGEKAAQLLRAAALRAKHKPA